MRLSMDHQLKQWRFLQQQQQQQQSDRPSAKVARRDHAQKPSEQESHPGISLFVREPTLKRSSTNMSAVPAPEPFGGSYKMGPFTFSQWQELKHQALIYKYMLVGAVIPLDLIQPIRNSVLHSYHHQQNPHFHIRYHHHQPSTLQSGYWGRALGDSEPGRCRRTDGKKWRCSRDVVTGQKYCERHVHRGKNRSRKPVETSTPVPSVTPNAFSVKNTLPSTLYPHASSSSKPRGSCFPFFDPSPSTDPFQLNLRSREGKMVNGPLMQNHQEKFSGEDSPGTGKVLRHFFDEWPTNPASSSSHRSVSISSNPDFSLKLFTGDVQNSDNGGGGYRRKPAPLASNWGIWENHNQEGSVGGPLAEALRSSGSSSSPTSVLQPKAKCSISESGSVSN